MLQYLTPKDQNSKMLDSWEGECMEGKIQWGMSGQEIKGKRLEYVREKTNRKTWYLDAQNEKFGEESC